MQHAITLGDVIELVLVVSGLVGAGLFFLVWLFNPFRSGH